MADGGRLENLLAGIRAQTAPPQPSAAMQLGQTPNAPPVPFRTQPAQQFAQSAQRNNFALSGPPARVGDPTVPASMLGNAPREQLAVQAGERLKAALSAIAQTVSDTGEGRRAYVNEVRRPEAQNEYLIGRMPERANAALAILPTLLSPELRGFEIAQARGLGMGAVDDSIAQSLKGFEQAQAGNVAPSITPDAGPLRGGQLDIPLYRGLSQPFDGAFRATENNIGPLGPGLSASTDRAYAASHGPHVLDLQARGPLATSDDYRQALAEARQRFGEASSAPGAPKGREVEALAGRILQERGFTGIQDGRETLLFADSTGNVPSVRLARASDDGGSALNGHASTPLFRGLSQPFDGRLRASSDNIGPLGPGLSTSRDRAYAAQHGPHVLGLEARGRIATADDYRGALGEARQRYDEAVAAPGAPKGREVEALAGQILRERGFVGIHDGKETLLFADPDGLVRTARASPGEGASGAVQPRVYAQGRSETTIRPDGEVSHKYRGERNADAGTGTPFEGAATMHAAEEALRRDIAEHGLPEYYWQPSNPRLVDLYRRSMGEHTPPGYVFSEDADGVMMLKRAGGGASAPVQLGNVPPNPTRQSDMFPETAPPERSEPYMPLGPEGWPVATDAYPFGFRRARGLRNGELDASQFYPVKYNRGPPDPLGVSEDTVEQAVPVSALRGQQGDINPDFLADWRSRSADDPITVEQADDGLFVLDGHHRLASDVARGEANTAADVVNRTTRRSPNQSNARLGNIAPNDPDVLAPPARSAAGRVDTNQPPTTEAVAPVTPTGVNAELLGGAPGTTPIPPARRGNLGERAIAVLNNAAALGKEVSREEVAALLGPSVSPGSVGVTLHRIRTGDPSSPLAQALSQVDTRREAARAALATRDARILELAQELNPSGVPRTRADTLGPGRISDNSLRAIADRMQAEGYSDVNKGIVGSVMNRKEPLAVPDASPRIAAELGIPEARVRAISARRSTPQPEQTAAQAESAADARRRDLTQTAYHATTADVQGPLHGMGSLGQGAYSSPSPRIAEALLKEPGEAFPEGSNIVPERVPSLGNYVNISKAQDDMYNAALRRGLDLEDPSATLALQNQLLAHYRKQGYVGIYDPDYAGGLGQLVTWEGKNRRAPWARMSEANRNSDDPLSITGTEFNATDRPRVLGRDDGLGEGIFAPPRQRTASRSTRRQRVPAQAWEEFGTQKPLAAAATAAQRAARQAGESTVRGLSQSQLAALSDVNAPFMHSEISVPRLAQRANRTGTESAVDPRTVAYGTALASGPTALGTAEYLKAADENVRRDQRGIYKGQTGLVKQEEAILRALLSQSAPQQSAPNVAPSEGPSLQLSPQEFARALAQIRELAPRAEIAPADVRRQAQIIREGLRRGPGEPLDAPSALGR